MIAGMLSVIFKLSCNNDLSTFNNMPRWGKNEEKNYVYKKDCLCAWCVYILICKNSVVCLNKTHKKHSPFKKWIYSEKVENFNTWKNFRSVVEWKFCQSLSGTFSSRQISFFKNGTSIASKKFSVVMWIGHKFKSPDQ